MNIRALNYRLSLLLVTSSALTFVSCAGSIPANRAQEEQRVARDPAASIFMSCRDLFAVDAEFALPHGQGAVNKSSYFESLDVDGNRWVSGRTFIYPEKRPAISLSVLL